MNAIVSFGLCTLSDKELLDKVDGMTDKMYTDLRVPTRQIPARPNADYDLLVGELVRRFYARTWLSTTEHPLITKDEKGNWTCTEDGDKPFIAALQYEDKRQPGKTLWWIYHCVIEDTIGLCVVGDDLENSPAGWEIEDIDFFIPMIAPPKVKSSELNTQVAKAMLAVDDVLKLINQPNK